MQGCHADTVTRCDSRADFDVYPCCGYTVAREPFDVCPYRDYSAAVGSPFDTHLYCTYRGSAADYFTCACAVAAFKLQRPVRMYLDHKTDMIMAGGRHPMKAKYSVGFKSDGKITALHLDLGINAGISADFSPIMPRAIIGALKKYN